ncbi:TonB-dependent receptor [Bosea sp. Leaf344]|uniref:TonB-dependent receptor n=1 Tax=Bosea sp. Leaf344 TaxID=1736346 RepID=UPI000AA9B752|nr:TonB-dependent receptor [Bosea sp. Leaf344]
MSRPLRALRLLATTALASAGTIPAAGSAWAQSAIELDEITVTARKRNERLWDVPFTVDAQSRQQLQESRSYDAPSALKDTAGVYMPTFGDRSTSFLVMRGVGPVLYPLSPDDSSVLTFVDGTPLPIGSSNGNYLDLERVEVLKGPQSTLFGRNTTGGAINLIPVLPDESWKGYLRSEYGSQNLRMLEGAVGGPLIKDKLGARLAFRLRGIDGFIPNLAGPRLGRELSGTGRLTLRFTPTDRTTWTIGGSLDASDGVPVYYALKGDGFFRPVAAQSLANEVDKNYTANSKFEHSFDHFTFTSQTSYNTIRGDLAYNGADFLLGSRLTGLPFSAFSPIAGNYLNRNVDQSRFTQELRLSANPGDALQWVAGISYYRDRAKLFSMRNVFFYGPAMAGYDNLHQTTDGRAVFGEVTYPLVEKLKLSLGGRYTREDKTFHAEYYSDGTPGGVPFFLERGSKDYNFWSGRASLSYDWSDKLMSYGSVSRGYKSGGFGTFNSLDWAGVPRKPYGSSTTISYEIGSRSSLLDDRLKLSAALFYNDVSKEQVMAYDIKSFSTQSINIDTESHGAELDATWKLGDHWELAGGVTYTSTELGDVPADVARAQAGMKKGNKLPQIPEWAGKASVTYRAPVAQLGLPALGSANLLARLGYNYLGPRFSDAGNVGKLKAVHLVSARLGVEWEKGEAYLFGENLLDKRNLNVSQPYGNSAITGAPISGVVYSRGATVGAGASLKF